MISDENETLRYYDENAEEYAQRTSNTDLSDLIDKFLAYLPQDRSVATILDLGCGAGRDSKAMMDLGYDVDMIDGSAELCRIATELTGKEALCLRFSQLDAFEAYAGIWCCGALLHVPYDELPDIIGKCRVALEPQGIMYASFKKGGFSGVRDGRYFTDLDLKEATALFEDAGFDVVEAIETEDRVGGRNVEWVNVFAQRI